MKQVRQRGLASLLALLLGGAADTGLAHHSLAAEFDTASTGELSGVISEVRFSNPNVRYRIHVTDADGSV